MNLPLDILLEILSRVSAKSLLRFKCVSNWFNCLICDVQFQNKHLGHALRCTTSKRLIANVESDELIVSCSLSSAYNNEIAWNPSDKYNEREDLISVLLLCSPVNGLCCVILCPPSCYFNWFDIHLWNPTINELRRLPNSSLYFSKATSKDHPFYGFCYNSTNDDYVLVRLITRLNVVLTETGSIKVEVYSLKNDFWRLIQPFPYNILLNFHEASDDFNCQFVNGRFHWMVLCDKGDCPAHDITYVIVSLNLSNYEYKDIPQPNYLKEPNILRHNPDYIDIVVLDGLLCVYCNYFQRCFDLWAMKDYGVQQSWAMMLSVPQDDIVASRNTLNLESNWLFRPLILFENGDILLVSYTNKKHLMVYKKDKKLFKSALGRELNLNGSSNIYIETLISPNRYITPAASRIIKFLNQVSRDKIIQNIS